MQTDRGEVLSVSVDRDDGPRELRRRLEAALGAASLAGASLSFGDQEIPLDQASPGALGRGPGEWGEGLHLARGEIALRLPTATPLLLRTSSPRHTRSRSAPDLLALLVESSQGYGGVGEDDDPSYFLGDEDGDDDCGGAGRGGGRGPGSPSTPTSPWDQAQSAPRGLLHGRRQRSHTAVVWGANNGRGGLDLGRSLGSGLAGGLDCSPGGRPGHDCGSAGARGSPAPAVVKVMGGPRAQQQAQSLQQAVRKGLKAGHAPQSLNQGLGGSYVFKGPSGESVGVAKPSDEEPLAPNNPKGFVGRALGDPGLKPTVRVGEAGLREVAASLLDHGGFASVPVTALVHIQHTIFHVEEGLAGRPSSWRGAPTKLVSLQEFVEHDSDAGDCGASSFPVEQVHRIGILDVRLFNTDRHSGNILIRQVPPRGRASSPGRAGGSSGGRGSGGRSKGDCGGASLGAQRNASYACFSEATAADGGGGGAGAGAGEGVNLLHRGRPCAASARAIHPVAAATAGGSGHLDSSVELVPIDHGFCLPETLEAAYFEWLHWPQSSMPFSKESLDYIAALNPRKDAKLLRQELPTLRTECLRVLEVTTTLLQHAAVAGLCLAEIGMLMSRPLVGLAEEPSELERMCLEARDATVASGALKGALRSSCLDSLCTSSSSTSPGGAGGLGRALESEPHTMSEPSVDEGSDGLLPVEEDEMFDMEDLVPHISALALGHSPPEENSRVERAAAEGFGDAPATGAPGDRTPDSRSVLSLSPGQPSPISPLMGGELESAAGHLSKGPASRLEAPVSAGVEMPGLQRQSSVLEEWGDDSSMGFAMAKSVMESSTGFIAQARAGNDGRLGITRAPSAAAAAGGTQALKFAPANKPRMCEPPSAQARDLFSGWDSAGWKAFMQVFAGNVDLTLRQSHWRHGRCLRTKEGTVLMSNFGTSCPDF